MVKLTVEDVSVEMTQAIVRAQRKPSDEAVGGQKVVKGGAADRPDFASRCSARRTMSARASSPTLRYRCCADPR